MLMGGGRILLKIRRRWRRGRLFQAGGRSRARGGHGQCRAARLLAGRAGPRRAGRGRSRSACPRRSRRSTTARSTSRAWSTRPRSARWRRARACSPGTPTIASAANAASRREMRSGGYKRICTACGTEHFPRTDPVAIMLTVTRDRCLLGRGTAFRAGHVFSARRLHRAGRDDRERGAARDARGSGHPARPRRLPRQPALAVPLFADDRLFRRGAERRHRRRPRRTGGLPLVRARRGAARCSAGRTRRCSPRRPAPSPII